MRSVHAWLIGACTLAAVLTPACEKDPAASVRIALNGLVDGGVAHGGERTRRPWRPSLCPPLPEAQAPAPSHLAFGGACAFDHASPVHCEVSQDDMYLTFSRPANEGAVVTLYVNVERYQGPGVYEAAEVLLTVRDRTALFRWSGTSPHVTIEAGETAVRFERAALSPEPGTSTEGDEWMEGVAACAERGLGD